VDIYDRRSWVVAVSILLLSFLDAAFTIFHLQAGQVREANPLLDHVLEFGGFYTFFSVKSAMTAFALAIIMLHKEWQLARFAVHVTLISYGLVTAYHAYLLLII